MGPRHSLVLGTHHSDCRKREAEAGWGEGAGDVWQSGAGRQPPGPAACPTSRTRAGLGEVTAFLSEALWDHSPGGLQGSERGPGQEREASECELRRQRRAGRGPPGGSGQLCPALTFQGFLRAAAALSERMLVHRGVISLTSCCRLPFKVNVML